MAQVFANEIPAPEFTEPDGKFSHSGYDARCEQYRKDTEAWIRSLGYNHKHTGKILRFPVADGYAAYMVINATSMVHLEEVDAYSIPAAHARGIRINEEVARMESFNAIFGRASV